MAVVDLYSYRKRVADEDAPDVFKYDILPLELRFQVIHIWKEAIGWTYLNRPSEVPSAVYNLCEKDWEKIHNTIAKEHGLLELGNEYEFCDRCKSYFLACNTIEFAIDIIEVSFHYMDRTLRKRDFIKRTLNSGITQTVDEAITELNERFRRASVGYRYESGKIIRIDSKLVHSEVVRPALVFLQQPGFEGPCDEFLQAHVQYRAGENREAITNANNAFESTLKVICDQKNWKYTRGARASDLLKTVKGNGLYPDYMRKSFEQLAATLNSALPVVRSEEGAHGQGAEPRKTPDHVAAYALHLAAAKILFLVEAHKATN